MAIVKMNSDKKSHKINSFKSNNMNDNYYMKNRKILLLMVEQLHNLGFGNLKIIPYIAPTGMHWRCEFISPQRKHSCIASRWLGNYEADHPQIKISPKALADLFVADHFDFILHCRGQNTEYCSWYKQMLNQLDADELPYAFDNFTKTEGYWLTSKDKKIYTLPNEGQDYFNKSTHH
jgi:hypothetical protein